MTTYWYRDFCVQIDADTGFADIYMADDSNSPVAFAVDKRYAEIWVDNHQHLLLSMNLPVLPALPATYPRYLRLVWSRPQTTHERLHSRIRLARKIEQRHKDEKRALSQNYIKENDFVK